MHSDERLALMPVLARGNHVHPRIGGCFAEVAATLAGHAWTDHPACIPPLLAQIARGVNDRTGPGNRTALASLIPWAIFSPRPPKDLTDDIVVTTALIELDHCEHPGDPSLNALLPRLERRPRPRHVLDRAAWRRAARRLVRAQLRSLTSTTDGPARDARLRALLVAAIDATRAVEALPPLHQSVDAPACGAHLLPVTTHLTSVDECLELRVRPLLDRWPNWIREPWNQRRSELGAGIFPDSEDRPEQLAGARELAPV